MAKRFAWSTHFLAFELASVVLLAGVFYLWIACFDGRLAVDELLSGKRDALYGTLASIYGALLGFVIAAITIALGYSDSDKMDVLRASRHYNTLWRTFTSSIWALSVATLVCVVALLFDKGPVTNEAVITLVVFGSGFAAVRVGRTIWVIEQLVDILTKRSGGSADGSSEK